jgi:hypothetical protein
VEEDRTGKSVTAFTLVEDGMRSAPELGVEQPVADEDRAFNPAHFAQRLIEPVLPDDAASFLRITEGGTRPAPIEAFSRKISSQCCSMTSMLTVPPISASSGS